MATGTEVSAYYGSFDLEELVKNAMWKDLLVELVQSNKLDPWDIDIAVIAEKYLHAIKRMKVLDLHIPANIIFAASLLLRMKSEMLQLFDLEAQDAVQESDGEPGDGIPLEVPNVPDIIFKMRTQPKRKITLEELMDALEEAIKKQNKREMREAEIRAPVQIKINMEDIGRRMQRVLDIIKGHVDQYKMLTFTELERSASKTDSVLLDIFVPLLFLAHRGYIALSQESFFDEIFIRLKREEIDAEQ
ncbi:MAG: ScpA family protein [Candidatus Micrarchaeaceae archaeon]